MPKNAEKIIEDIELSRYACYLIVQNGDSKKEVIALGHALTSTAMNIYAHSLK